MKTLATIKDTDIRPGYIANQETSYKSRMSPRAVLFDKDNKIALLNVKKYNYYKLPGGGAEGAEDIKAALCRECLEETGCKIIIKSEIGQIVEHRDEWKLIQTSPSFIAVIDGEKGTTSFEGDEIEYGFELIWVDIDEALSLIKNSMPNDDVYDSKFIVKRDFIILEEAKKINKEDIV